MPIKRIAACALLSLTFITAHATTAQWPRLGKVSKHAECKTALGLASAAFKSSTFRLWSASTPLPGVSAKTVFWVSASESYGQINFDGSRLDESVFKEISVSEGDIQRINWQRETGDSPRLVIEQRSFGSNDLFDTYAVPKDISESDYVAQRKNEGFLKPFSLDAGGWLPPFVFLSQTQSGNVLGAIGVGHPADFLPNWHVYLPINGQYQKACEIEFRPRVSHPKALLPQAVRSLADLLFKTVGDVPDMFTRKPAIEQAWANAAMRPWTDFPSYNSRETVDRALAGWAQQGRFEHRLYARIRAQYPRAEAALARHYQTQFKMPQAAAQTAAKQALDGVLRTHSLFSESS